MYISPRFKVKKVEEKFKILLCNFSNLLTFPCFKQRTYISSQKGGVSGLIKI